MNELKWTGERLVTTEFNEIAVEHLARYTFCLPLLKGRKVLDIACGEGYGTRFISDVAIHVTGVDIDPMTINHAREKYKISNIEFVETAVHSLPFQDATFDAIVSFETIEHLKDQEQMIGELKRVLKKDGLLIISTPNKDRKNGQNEFVSPFHEKELSKGEFESLLRQHFRFVEFYFQQNLYGSFIFPYDSSIAGITEIAGDFCTWRAEQQLSFPSFFIAIAGQESSPNAASLFFHSQDIYEKRFIALKDTLTYKTGAFILAPLRFFRQLIKPLTGK